MNKTSIEWSDWTSNPLKYRDQSGRVVWACVKHSSGCANCYAEALAERYKRGGPFTRSEMEKLTPFVDEAELKHILTAKVIAGKPVAGSRCFLGDMTDLFGEWIPDELLDRLFAVMALRSDVTFQILTKRADRMRRYFADGHRNGRGNHTSIFVARHISDLAKQYGFDPIHVDQVSVLGHLWPANIWGGISAENQDAADTRIPDLLATPAAVRFLSCEPLLGVIDLEAIRIPLVGESFMTRSALHGTDGLNKGKETPGRDKRVDWVIIGGESGPDSRPMQIEWMRSIVKQCKEAGVACFVKQLGSKPQSGGESCNAWPIQQLKLKSKKGGNPDEWPADLRIRQFPEAKAA